MRPRPIPRAYEVHYGNTLTCLCRDQGQAEKTLVVLHGTEMYALFALNRAQIEWLMTMPEETECES